MNERTPRGKNKTIQELNYSNYGQLGLQHQTFEQGKMFGYKRPGSFSRTAPKFKLIEEKWRIIPFSVDAVAVIVEPINSTMAPFNDSCFFLPKPVRQPN